MTIYDAGLAIRGGDAGTPGESFNNELDARYWRAASPALFAACQERFRDVCDRAVVPACDAVVTDICWNVRLCVPRDVLGGGEHAKKYGGGG